MFFSQHPFVRGAFLSFFAFTAWACGDALTKSVGLAGAPPLSIVALSSLVGSLTVLLGTALRRDIGRLKPRRWKPVLLRSAVFFGIPFLNIPAFTNLPLTTVYIGLFSSPLLLSLIGFFFMGEPLGRRQTGGIALGFAGVLIALLPTFLGGDTGPGNPIVGYMALPLFLAAFVVDMLLMRVLGRTETAEAMTFIRPPLEQFNEGLTWA